MEIPIILQKTRPGAREPRYATPGAAAMDMHACLDAPLTIPPGGQAAVPTGLALALPSGDFVGLVFSRSGHGFKRGVTLVNAVGVIDADYRGEVLVGLVNRGDEPFVVSDGDRIVQLAVLPIVRAAVTWADELPGSRRGTGGFGSTGERPIDNGQWTIVNEGAAYGRRD